MNSFHGILVGVTVSLLGLAGVGDLRAAEDRPASFDCAKDRSPLAVTVCSDRTATAAERRTTASYLAVYFGLSDESRPGFHHDHTQWLSGLTARCSSSPSLRQVGGDQAALSLECVRRSYTQRGDLYRKRLSGAALEESNLASTLLKKLQKRLVDLKFLPGTVDGVFGADTRGAIKSFQASIGHAQSNFLTAQERNMLLEPNGLPAQPVASKQPPVSVPESTSEAPPPPPPPAVQNLQSTDGRPREPDTTDHAAEQSAQQNTPDAVKPPANADAAAGADEGGELQTRYFVEGALLAAAILAFTAIFVFIRLRRRTKRARGDGEVGPAFGAPPSVSLRTDSLRTGPSTTGKHAGPSAYTKAHASAGGNPSHAVEHSQDPVNGVIAAVTGDDQPGHVDAPLAPERMVELLPHLEKDTKL
jgi:peptidoglycan hydrolase-like protein with peptidoglycan-binding domain